MLIEPEIHRLFAMEEAFCDSYFAYLDEYDALMEKYLHLYAFFEETIDDESFAVLEKMIRCQKEMEKFRAMHHFRQGVLMSGGLSKREKPL